MLTHGSKNRNISRFLISQMKSLYVSNCVVLGALLFLTFLGDDVVLRFFLVFACVALGILNLWVCWRATRLLLRPVAIFSLLWLIVVPLTSFEVPLMEAMSAFQWRQVLLFALTFMMASLLFAQDDLKPNEVPVTSLSLSRGLAYVMYGTIVVTVIAVLFDAIINGGFIISADDVNVERHRSSFPGYYLLRALGNLGVSVLAFDKTRRKGKSFIMAFLVMTLVNFSIGVRFGVFVLGIAVVSCWCADRFEAKRLRALVIIGACAVLVFTGISIARDDEANKTLYYITLGGYSGTVDSLTSTELIRYFGYSQRLMEEYMANEQGGVASGAYTLTPLFDFFQIESEYPPRIQVQGYNATNIISYLYQDFGQLWPVAAFVWSALINAAYRWRLRKPGLFSFYWCSVAYVNLALSFYAYVYAFSYWLVTFPILLLMVSALFHVGRKPKINGVQF